MANLPDPSNPVPTDFHTRTPHPDRRSKLAAKISQFSNIPAGWLEGEGTPFDPTDLTWMTNPLVKHLPSHIPEPAVTPTADGEVRLEWGKATKF